MARGDPRTAPLLRVAISDARGRPVSPALGRWLAAIAPRRARGAVNVAIVSDSRIRSLNKRFRGIDRLTDVLSFQAERVAVRAPRLLGDIVIARGVARRQARGAGHSEATELRVLALHGLLHLLGYDHEDADDHGAMARLERRLRRRGGLEAGLIERA